MIGKVISALSARGCRVRRLSATKARAQCPVHRDARPSLAIDERDGVVLLKCFAGCGWRGLLQALDLTAADLRGEAAGPRSYGPQHIIASYEYADLSTRVYARKLRLGPMKAFRWQRRDDSTRTGWRARLDGLKPSLYRLDDIIDAKRVFVVEGEKTTDLLRRAGIVAVNPPVGANLWLDHWSEALWRAGAVEVVILPDADKPGRSHALEVAKRCFEWRPTLAAGSPDDPWPDVMLQPEDPEAAPLQVKVIELTGLAHGEDPFDWLTSHRHSVAELFALVENAPLWTPTDPVMRARELNRQRQRRFRDRRRAAAVTRERSVGVTREGSDQEKDRTDSCSDQITHGVTRYAPPKSAARCAFEMEDA